MFRFIIKDVLTLIVLGMFVAAIFVWVDFFSNQGIIYSW